MTNLTMKEALLKTAQATKKYVDDSIANNTSVAGIKEYNMYDTTESIFGKTGIINVEEMETCVRYGMTDFQDCVTFAFVIPTNDANYRTIAITAASELLHFYVSERWTDESGDFIVLRTTYTDYIINVADKSTQDSVTYEINDRIDYLTFNRTKEYIPETDYNPATKKYVDDSIAKVKLPITEQITINTEVMMPWIYFMSSPINSRKELLGCELSFTAMVIDNTETEDYHEETIKVTFTQEIIDGLYSTSEGLDYFLIEKFLDAEERKNITGMIAFYPGQALIVELHQGDKIVGDVKDVILTKTVKVYEKDTLIDVSYMEAKLPFDDYKQFIEPSYEDDNQFYFCEYISDLSILKGAKLMFVIGGPISSPEEDEVIDIVELEFTDEVYNTFYQQVGTYRLDQMLTPEENSRNLYGGFVFTEENGQGILFRIYNTPSEGSDSVYYKVPEASLEIKVKGYANDTLVDKEYVDGAIDTDNLVVTNSISMGRKEDTTIGIKSVALGDDVEASGKYSHAEGFDTEASGDNSHAEGGYTTASGYASHAEGYETTASSECSHAEGYKTKASSQCQHVQGKLNIEDTTNTYLHIVGNGKNDASTNYSDARSNAHTLDWDGNAWFAGDVYVGGTSQDTDSNKLATEAYVNDNKFSGDYNDLTNKPVIPTVSNDLTNTLKTNYDEAYTHSQAVHAPSNAQKNSDITKAEIEAKLTGDITSHTHSAYATTSYVDSKVSSIKLIQITQTEYDALTTKDPNTLYLITE